MKDEFSEFILHPSSFPRAGDLVPHEWNFRLHPEAQAAALQALYQQVGFARSLLAYELPDGRLKLIDGHLRRDMDTDMEGDVKILDVTDEEARTLLLSIDPLAALAETQEQLHRRLEKITPTEDEELRALWQRTAEPVLEEPAESGKSGGIRCWLNFWWWSHVGMRGSRWN